MSKNTTKKEVTPKVLVKKEVKVKTPKFKLITYTVKAVIPTGMYANIQPEITVEASSIEVAERAVMPHIESLFAKYREGGVQPVVARNVAPVVVTPNKPTPPGISAPIGEDGPIGKNRATGATGATVVPVVPVVPSIVMSLPFTRANSAIQSCMSLEALQLVEDQIQKSTKLIDDEKQNLAVAILKKRKEWKN